MIIRYNSSFIKLKSVSNTTYELELTKSTTQTEPAAGKERNLRGHQGRALTERTFVYCTSTTKKDDESKDGVKNLRIIHPLVITLKEVVTHCCPLLSLGSQHMVPPPPPPPLAYSLFSALHNILCVCPDLCVCSVMKGGYRMLCSDWWELLHQLLTWNAVRSKASQPQDKITKVQVRILGLVALLVVLWFDFRGF